MGWRQKMGATENEHFKTYTQYTQNAQKGGDIEYRNEKVKNPSGPVAVKMKSAILGATVDVSLEPNHATVDGVEYSLDELADLINRGISAADLQTVHRVKEAFQGAVIPAEEVENFEPISRW